MIGHFPPSFQAHHGVLLFSLRRWSVAVLLLFISASALFAQHWITKASSPQADHIADLVPDGAGNSYVIGDFSLSASFTQGTNTLGSLASAGGRDVLVGSGRGWSTMRSWYSEHYFRWITWQENDVVREGRIPNRFQGK